MGNTGHTSGRGDAPFRTACTFTSVGCLLSCLPVDHAAVRRHLDSWQVLHFMLNSRRLLLTLPLLRIDPFAYKALPAVFALKATQGQEQLFPGVELSGGMSLSSTFSSFIYTISKANVCKPKSTFPWLAEKEIIFFFLAKVSV